ncbi:MAG: triose-phosphate isomerase [Legionellaceae bacterium]|nr:triose-phosphate isomerase [Legionellaceae bacterium]
MGAEKKLVFFNWKNKIISSQQATTLAEKIASNPVHKDVSIALFPSDIYLYDIKKLTYDLNIKLGAQNCDMLNETLTGGASLQALKNAGCSYVILGHSERRAKGETSENIRLKSEAVGNIGMIPLICVGETQKEHKGNYLAIIEKQLRDSLSHKMPKNLIVAYGPMWAKSAGEIADPGKVSKTCKFIRNIVKSTYSKGNMCDSQLKVLYGGSVDNNEISEDIMKSDGVDGVFVGSAGLNAEKSRDIIAAAARAAVCSAL